MNKLQLTSLVILRMLIGWHLLYEGVVKLLNPNWSAAGYLSGSDSLFGLFSALGSSSALVGIVDFITVWVLVLAGLCLILGIFNKAASFGGIVLLAMFYLSYPPLPGFSGAMPAEGSYILVNKNLIELFALMVVMAFPTTEEVGIARFFKRQEPTPSTSTN